MKGVALAEATMAVPGEGRVIGHGGFGVGPAEPATCQVQLNLLAQSALGADAKTIADDRLADHQLRVAREVPVVLGRTSLTYHLDAPVVAMGSKTSEKDA